MTGLLVLGAGGAFAELNSTPREKTWVTNGAVRAIVPTATTTYIGGDFTYVGPNTGSFAALDVTGAPVLPYAKVDSVVKACLPDGAGGWYIGGTFTKVGGATRNRIAHILSDGSVDPAWDPNADNAVFALAVSGTTVYAGGTFTTIGGQPRSFVAALDSTTGASTAWNPNASNTVCALSVSGTTVYAGGAFTTIGGQTRNFISALDAATGAATAWNPNASSAVYALAVSGTMVYAGGSFTTIGGQARNRIAALDATMGTATAWAPNASNTVYALSVSGATVYAGGVFSSIGGQMRSCIAALNATTGLAVTTWNPNANSPVFALALSGTTVYAGGAFTTIGGQPRNYIAALDAATGTATARNPNAIGEVWALAVSGTTVCAGGDFASIGGQTRNYIAALDATTGLATAWNPSASGSFSTAVLALAVSDTMVYAGGSFTSIGGQLRNYIAALDVTTGLATAWDPNANSTVQTLVVSGTTVYAGGNFTTIGGQARNYIAALDATVEANNATVWNPNANGTVYALAVSGTTVYAGGNFTTIGGQTRNRIAALDATVDANNATAWNPNANSPVQTLAVSGTTVHAGGIFTSIGGQPRNCIAALDTATGSATTWNPNANGTVYALAVSGTTVYAGGGFTSIGGQTRNRIAALDATVDANNATVWNPNANNFVYGLAVSGTALYAGGTFTTIGGQGRPCFSQFDTPIPAPPSAPGATAIGTDTVTWTWQDNSSDETGFTVYADLGAGAPTTLQTTTAADATDWTHGGLSVNTQHTFQVAATNANGDSVKTAPFSAWTLAAVPTAPAVGNPSGATLDLSVGAGDGNPADTEYALRCVTTGQWVQADGTLGASAVWQTAADWGTVTVTGLAEYTAHTFEALARNGAGVETAPGPQVSAMTLDVTSPTAAVTLLDPTPMPATVLNYSVTFSEPVAPTFTADDVSLTGGLAGSVAVTPDPGDPSYLVTVTLTGTNPDGLTGIAIGTDVQDMAGNGFAGAVSPDYDVVWWPGFAAPLAGAQGYTGDAGPVLDAALAAGGARTPAWQWLFDRGTSPPPENGPTTAAWDLGTLSAAMDGEYWCAVTYGGLVFETNHVGMQVRDRVSITAQPTDQSASPGGSATFTVAAAGGYTPLHYQWKHGGANAPGSPDTAEWTLENVTEADAGAYSVEVSDSHNDSTASDAATLTVEEGVPVAGLLGLAALAGALAMAGRRTARRGRK